jgi:tRNA-specific 2-thiouridylase
MLESFMKILVGMSGGVDSSMAACLLKEGGYEVEGLSLLLFETKGRKGPAACCSLETLEGARETAKRLGIPHSTLDARDAFIEKVIEPFADAYTRGLTPNPCVLCNRLIKFPLLLNEADRRGIGLISTGHYASVDRESGTPLLKTGLDPGKDQSYFLYVLKRDKLDRIVFPLGKYTKEQVRKMAKERGLPVFSRPESQEICFIQKDYGRFVCALSPESCTPGPIKDASGRTLGKHKGIHNYTLGQRRGLGIASPSPLYVTAIEVNENAVYVGAKEDTLTGEFLVTEPNWLLSPERDFRAVVKVRSTMEPRPATIHVQEAGHLKVVFDEPFDRPAPGQSAVFYDGDTVIGGGEIAIKQVKP